MARLLAAVLLACAGCAPRSGRVDVLSRAPAFKPRLIAVAAPRGAGEIGGPLPGAVVAALGARGLRAVSLESSDSLSAGRGLGLRELADPAALAEARSATGADAVLFLSFTAGRRALELTVLDAARGEVGLRARALPRGRSFASAADAAQAAAHAVSAAPGGWDELPPP